MDEPWTAEVVRLDDDLMITVTTGTTTGLVPSATRIFGVGCLDEHGLVFSVAETAEHVEVRLAGGHIERPPLVQVPDSPAKYFALPLRPGQQPLRVVAFSSSGDELATKNLDRLGRV